MALNLVSKQTHIFADRAHQDQADEIRTLQELFEKASLSKEFHTEMRTKVRSLLDKTTVLQANAQREFEVARLAVFTAKGEPDFKRVYEAQELKRKYEADIRTLQALADKVKKSLDDSTGAEVAAKINLYIKMSDASELYVDVKSKKRPTSPPSEPKMGRRESPTHARRPANSLQSKLLQGGTKKKSGDGYYLPLLYSM